MFQIKQTYSSLILLIVLFLSGQYAEGQSLESDAVERKFQVQLDKPSYLPLEPIVVEFSANLKHTDAKPVFGRDVTMTVFSDGQVREAGSIGPTEEPAVQLPSNLRQFSLGVSKPDEVVSYRGVIAVTLASEYLSAPGTYQLQFFLHTSGSKIASEVVTVSVDSPKGVDLKAFRFLTKEKGTTSFDWVWKQKDGVRVLSRFVDEFAGSVYSDYAILYLGNVQLAKNEVDAAQKQFEKITNNSNSYLSENAKRNLDEIERRKSRAVDLPQ
ncbi:MAG: hypothetical protein ABI481_04605 [Pyrinomonadaceae bacterium]